MALFRNRVFMVTSALGFFTGMGLFGAISFVPLFVQGVLFGFGDPRRIRRSPR